MLPVTFNGESVYLLPYTPNWVQPFQATFALPVNIDKSKGGITARTPDGETLRETQKFSLVLKGARKSAFTVALQRLGGNQRVLCPFWPSAHLAYNGVAIYTAPDGSVYTDDGTVYTSGEMSSPWLFTGIWLTYEPGFTAWEVHTTDAPAGFTPSVNAVRVPLLLGHLRPRPAPTATTDERLSGTINFIESSPAEYALRPIAIPAAEGPSLGSRTPPIFNFLANWSVRPSVGTAERDADFEQIGSGREVSVTAYPQNSVRRLEATYLCRDWPKLAALVSFFLQRKGQTEVFWLPGLLSECRLSEPTSSASAIIHVDNAAGLGDNRYIAFTRGSQPPICRKVLAVDLAANTLTLDSSPGDLAVGSVNLVSLILARFAKPALELNFSTDSRTTARIEFLEVPDEYFNPSGEVLGQTMGARPAQAWLYKFIREYPAETVVQRFTSWERDLLVEGELWSKRPIEHDVIVESVDPDQSKLTLKARHFADNPLSLLFTHALEVPLLLEVRRCQPQPDGTANSVEKLFMGEVSAPKSNGPVMTGVVSHRLAIFQQKVPVPVIQPDCNWDVFSEPCVLAASDWTWSASIVAISGGSLTLGSFVRLNGGPSIAFGVSWFSFGRLWLGSTAADYAQRTIYDSTALSNGQVIVSLARGFIAPPAIGTTVYLRPGCNRTVYSCRTKFDNYIHFGGTPFVPVGNPSFVLKRVTANPNASKK